jgi:hypothetical protein
MIFRLERYSSNEWLEKSRLTHKVVFGEDRDPLMNRIDYGLVVFGDDVPCGYATVIEVDKETAYMQHGGAFPSVSKSIYAIKCYQMIIKWLKERYKIITTKIFSTNIPMLKLAFSVDLIINGAEIFDGKVLLNLAWRQE